ncbi:MAG: DUF1634 domain-containing protein [Chloroflexi bacterium]|nr:DUF1634 domain-containing protein [Chloroflexota bacterium]
MTTDRNDVRLYAWLRQAFLTGLVSSFVLTIIGFIWISLQGAPVRDGIAFGGVLSSLLHGEPAALVSLGILALLLTPIIAVIICAVYFIIRRELTYAAMALVILCILSLGVVLGAT